MLFHMYGFEPNTYDKINLTSNTLKNLNFLPLSCILNYFYVYSYETILNVPKDIIIKANNIIIQNIYILKNYI